MTNPTMTIAGETFTLKPMTDGQLESLFRIQRAISAAGDRDAMFYGRQIGRFGDLVDSLLASVADQERLDRLLLTGQTNTTEIVTGVMRALRAPEPEPAPAKKAVVKAVKAPAKKAAKAAKKASGARQ